MVFIDGSALSVALPALRDGLGAGPEALNWIINAYVLALAALTLIGGAAADRFGRKRIFLIGAAGFALASILCGMARTPEALIAARGLQGVFGAMLAPASLAMITAAYPRAERAGAIGAWAGASALTTAGGPVVAGILVDGFHWSTVFFINAPIAAGACILAAGFSPETRDETPRPFDLTGAGLIASSLALIAWGLVAVGEEGRSLGAAAPWLLGGAVLFAAFWRWETISSHPMAPPGLFAIPALFGANLFTLLAYAALGAALFALPLLLAEEREWSASAIGMAFLPFALAVGLLSRVTGGLAAQFGQGRMIGAGAVIAAAGFFGLGAVPTDAPAWLSVYMPMGVIGVGFAAFIPPLTDIAVSSAPDTLEGTASGVNNAVSRIAQMLGVAGAAAAFAAGAPETSYPAAAMLMLLGGFAAIVGIRAGRKVISRSDAHN